MRILLVICCCLTLASCKKDELTGDLAFLEGRWEWIYSKEYIPSWGGTYYHFPSPDSTYAFEFEKEGRVTYYINGEKEFKRRLQIVWFENYPVNGGVHFKMNNRDKLGRITVRYNSTKDTIRINQFPFPTFVDEQQNQHQMTNYFVKVP